MKKNYIEEKGLRIEVIGNGLNFYKDDKLVAKRYSFSYEDNYEVIDNMVQVIFSTKKGFLSKVNGINLTLKGFGELIEIEDEIEDEINLYFNNIENAELTKLSNGTIAFTIELDKELSKLNENYFEKAKKNWIDENKKYFVEDKGYNKAENGMMYPYINYTFSKENIEKVNAEIKAYEQTEEYKEKQLKDDEDNERYIALSKFAKKSNDEDFEDITGLQRINYL